MDHQRHARLDCSDKPPKVADQDRPNHHPNYNNPQVSPRLACSRFLMFRERPSILSPKSETKFFFERVWDIYRIKFAFRLVMRLLAIPSTRLTTLL